MFCLTSGSSLLQCHTTTHSALSDINSTSWLVNPAPIETSPSSDEAILDKLRRRNPKGAADVKLTLRAPAAAAAAAAATAATAAGEAASGGSTASSAAAPPPKRDLDAIFGARPATPAAASAASVASAPSAAAAAAAAAGKSSAVASSLGSKTSRSAAASPGASAEKLSWGLKAGDEPGPLGGATLGGSDAAAETEEEEEEEEGWGQEGEEGEGGPAFGPARYNSKEAQERRILEAAAEKLLQVCACAGVC